MSIVSDVTDPIFGGQKQTGAAQGSFGGKGNKQNIAALFGNPVFLQALYALSAAGQNPFEELGQFFSKGKPPKGGQPGQFLKVGGSYLDLGQLSANLPKYTALQEDAAIKAQTATYQKLKDTPQFANIYNEANGQFSPEFDAQVSKAFGQLGNYALGAGVKSGFLDDPNKQAAILAPVGVQLAQYKQQVKKQAEAQALGYSGAGYLSQNEPAGLLGANPAQSYLPGIFGSAGNYQNNAQFNSNLGFQQYAQYQQDAVTAGGVLGAAAYYYGNK